MLYSVVKWPHSQSRNLGCQSSRTDFFLMYIETAELEMHTFVIIHELQIFMTSVLDSLWGFWVRTHVFSKKQFTSLDILCYELDLSLGDKVILRSRRHRFLLP